MAQTFHFLIGVRVSHMPALSSPGRTRAGISVSEWGYLIPERAITTDGAVTARHKPDHNTIDDSTILLHHGLSPVSELAVNPSWYFRTANNI